jgi:cobaltochelatase CobS
MRYGWMHSMPYHQLLVAATKFGIEVSFIGGGRKKWLRKTTVVERCGEKADRDGSWAELKQIIADVKAGKFGEIRPTQDGAPEIVTEKVDENALRAQIRAELEKELAGGVQTIEVKFPDGTRKEMKGALPREFETILQLASQRVNVLMVGPAGCGKTYLAEKVAEALSLPFHTVSCSVGMSESTLAGWLLPTGSAGRFEYHASPFVECYEKGGVFLFDEIDGADPNTLTFLNAALANGHMTIPQRLGNAVVKRHKDFVCLAAANTFGLGADMKYVGRNQLDAATLDRFRAGVVTMDYDPRVEAALCDAEVLAWGQAIRKQIAQHGIERIMSMRTLIAFSKMKEAYGWGADRWSAQYFCDWTADEKSRLGV